MNTNTPPIRLTIPGSFWDSQIYSGTLYLFGRSGEIITHSWNRVVSDLLVPPELRVVADAALLGNHRLYETGARQLINDPEIRPLLESKFHRLAAAAEGWELSDFSEARFADNPFPFPHTDSEIHYHQLFVGASTGLYSRAPREVSQPSSRVVKHTDTPALDIAAKFYALALAAGSDGLYEVRLPGERQNRETAEVAHLSSIPCVSCEWAFSSVIASGYDSSAYIASFAQYREEGQARANRRFTRKFDRVIPESELFATTPRSRIHATVSFTWGAREKIFRYHDGHVEVVRYSPRAARADESEFSRIGEFSFPEDRPLGSIVSAKVAPFGSIIERDESLLVFPTTGSPLMLPGEPVNWRVYPRSVDYANHLHVIYEDRMEIWAFTHDYFVDQETKLVGLEVGSGDAG